MATTRMLKLFNRLWQVDGLHILFLIHIISSSYVIHTNSDVFHFRCNLVLSCLSTTANATVWTFSMNYCKKRQRPFSSIQRFSAIGKEFHLIVHIFLSTGDWTNHVSTSVFVTFFVNFDVFFVRMKNRFCALFPRLLNEDIFVPIEQIFKAEGGTLLKLADKIIEPMIESF